MPLLCKDVQGKVEGCDPKQAYIGASCTTICWASWNKLMYVLKSRFLQLRQAVIPGQATLNTNLEQNVRQTAVSKLYKSSLILKN